MRVYQGAAARRCCVMFAICAILGLTACPSSMDFDCGPQGIGLKQALTTVQVSVDSLISKVEALTQRGTLSLNDEKIVLDILDALSAATAESLVEATNNSDNRSCYRNIARNYSEALNSIPTAPSDLADDIGVIVDLISAVISLVS